MDYLPNEDIVYWLNNLEKESGIRDYTLTDFQIEYIWDHFGGSLWEISVLLGDLLRVCRNGKVSDENMGEIAERYLLQAESYFEEYAALDTPRTELLRLIIKNVQDKSYVKESFLGPLFTGGFYAQKQGIQDELHHLVQQNYLYYNPTRAEYKLQGRSMEIGLDRYIRDIH